MTIKFTKMSGAGNDFVVVDNRMAIISDPEAFALSVCNRRLGIGGDGLLLVEQSSKADFMMKYYNADGSNAGMCGNGGRCIAKFSYDNGIVTKNEFAFEAFGHIYTAARIDSVNYELKMKDPVSLIRDQMLQLPGTTLRANYLNTGTDHSIVFLDDNTGIGTMQSLDVIGLGKSLRNHAAYQPLGTNVNFVQQIIGNQIQIRTYERGVEDETLACGTGSVASALLSSIKFGMKSPVKVKVQSGEFLEITFDRSGDSFTNVRLKGSAKNVFIGAIDL